MIINHISVCNSSSQGCCTCNRLSFQVAPIHWDPSKIATMWLDDVLGSLWCPPLLPPCGHNRLERPCIKCVLWLFGWHINHLQNIWKCSWHQRGGSAMVTGPCAVESLWLKPRFDPPPRPHQPLMPFNAPAGAEDRPECTSHLCQFICQRHPSSLKCRGWALCQLCLWQDAISFGHISWVWVPSWGILAMNAILTLVVVNLEHTMWVLGTVFCDMIVIPCFC